MYIKWLNVSLETLVFHYLVHLTHNIKFWSSSDGDLEYTSDIPVHKNLTPKQ